MKRKEFEELLTTNRDDLADRYKSAAVIMEECGDSEIAGILNTLSAQMDFSDNENASDAIERTRNQLDEAIKRRKDCHSDQYIKHITDDEILKISGGEVTESDYSIIHSCFLKNGLFDPDIFGGSGKIPVETSDGMPDLNGYGMGIGHIVLPCRVVLSRDYNTVASLLKINISDVEDVVNYRKCIVLKGNENYPVGTVLTEMEFAKTGTDVLANMGGNAIYEILKGLGYPDHPERLAFKVMPVIAPIFRCMVYVQEDDKMAVHPVTNMYAKLIERVKRCRRLMEIGAPNIIISNEMRMINELIDDFDEFVKEESHDILRRYQKEDRKTMTFSIIYLNHIFLVARRRRFGFEFVKGEKTGEIESLNLYPEKIKLLGDDGQVSDIPFEDIISSCTDMVSDYRNSHALILEYGEEPDDDEQAALEAAEKYVKKIDGIIESIWRGAKNEREKFMVRFNHELNFYEPCKAS